MYTIGVDLGGTNIKAGITDDAGRILFKSSVSTRSMRHHKEVIDDIGLLCKRMIEENKLDINELRGIGVGCPGAINSKDAVVDYSNNLNWKNVRFGEILKKHIDTKIMISNDANVAALGETLFGIGKNYSDTILLTLGTGVGGGIIINNKLYEGNESKGAEVGHMVMVVDGEKCTCGRYGCMEAYCSATALIRDTRRAMESHPESAMHTFARENGGVDGRTAFECSKSGDGAAKKVVDNYIKFLGEGILNFANIFRPEAVILGGGVCAQGDYLLDKLNCYCKERNYGYTGSPPVRLLIASLGNDAGIIGAASLIISSQDQ